MIRLFICRRHAFQSVDPRTRFTTLSFRNKKKRPSAFECGTTTFLGGATSAKQSQTPAF